jgi:ankyrin repeat protein
MAKAGTGMSPLHVAVTQPPGRENIIKILLDAGAPIDKQSVYHGTAMHYAFRHNRPVALRMLVERKANVTLFDAENQRPLQRGAQVGSVEAVREFLSIAATNPAYFKVVDQPDLLGNTALATACSTGQTEIVKLLLQAKRPGLKDSTRMVPMVDRNKVNSRGNTCLHVAAALDFEEIIDALFESELIGNRAISSGKYPDMNKKNADGKTPLDLATKKAAKASLKKFAHIQPDKTEL